jgi:branched-chain amino acid aminotransferase
VPRRHDADTVFVLAAQTNLQVRKQPLAPDTMRKADEVFISTTGGGIIPITTVDGLPIASGQPGPVTRRLDDLYWSKRRADWLTTPIDYDAPLRFEVG